MTGRDMKEMQQWTRGLDASSDNYQIERHGKIP